MLAVVTIPDEHAGDIPWALKTCLYRQSIDTVYIALDYLDRVPGVKDLNPFRADRDPRRDPAGEGDPARAVLVRPR